MFKAPASLRLFFLLFAGTLWLGISLTGFDKASWLLYVDGTLLLIAAATGLCPGLIASRFILGDKSLAGS